MATWANENTVLGIDVLEKGLFLGAFIFHSLQWNF